MQQLKGKVTFDDDTPVTTGYVIFLQGNHQSRGEIKPDGTYMMGSEKENNGIPPGEYQVYVSGICDPPPPGQMMPIPLCDPKYENADTSGLTCKIPAPKNRFDITIERRK